MINQEFLSNFVKKSLWASVSMVNFAVCPSLSPYYVLRVISLPRVVAVHSVQCVFVISILHFHIFTATMQLKIIFLISSCNYFTESLTERPFAV